MRIGDRNLAMAGGGGFSTVFVFVIGIFATIFTKTDGCGDIGAINPGSHIDATGAQTGQTFFVESPASLCCGTLKNWKFYASATGDLTTMLWRPTTGANYELIATDTFTVAVGLSTPIPASLVEVQTGDVIGWETSGAELIPSSAGSSTTTQNQLLAAVSVGSDVPWSGTQDTTNTYAFGAVVEANTAPVVNGDAFSIGEADVSQSIHTVDITDTDSIDITADTFSVSMTGDSAFSLVKTVTGYDIETGASLTSGTYELVVTATDRCSESASATVTVTVTNDAPVFNPDPLLDVHPISISDATTSATSLYRFSVTDTDTVTCLSDNSLFEIQTVTTNVYELWLKSIADADLNYDTATSQIITISCTDSSTSISSTYTVNISDEPPVISSLSGTTGPISDLSPAGTSIHQFTVTDQDDVISCSVDAPEDVVFSITALDGSAGTQRFEIETASTVNEDTAASYTVGISCTDLQNPDVTGSRLVTLTDDPPVLDGLPATSAALFDGTQTAAVLGTFSVTDANDQGIIACAVQAPNAGLFSVAAGTVPEFEVSVIDGVTLSTGTYDLDIDCDDDEAVNTVSGVFSVPVTDEPPAFVGTFPSDSADLSDDTTVETSLAAFTVSEAVTCSVTDPAGTIYETRTSDPLQQAFEIWVANTVTEADINFNDQAVPLTLTITCSDGTTDITETFNVNIVDAVPTLTGLPGTDYDGIYDNTTTELFLDTFDVTDSDDTVTCTIDAGDPSASLFEIRSGTAPEFEIWLSAGASLDFATTPSYDLPITCSDGDNSVTGTKTVLILNTPPDVTVEPEITDPVSDSLNVRTLLARVRSTATCTHSADAPYDNDFQFRKTGAEVYQIRVNAGNNLNYDVDPFVIITFTCTDGISTATATYNLTLFDEDPVMTGLPDIFQSLSDEDTARTLLHTFTMSDSDDTITCVVDPATPEASFFEVVAGTAPDFEIYFLGSPPTTLDAATTPFYNLSITCDDGAIYQLNTTYDVEVEDAPPVFLNLPASTPSIAENVITKTPLYTVTATDKSELTCYLADTVTAAGIPPLEFNSYTDPNTVYDVYGYHTTGFDFEGTGGTVTVDITCGDQSSTVTDTLTINIINSAPEILNPGGSTIISESETGELSLKTLSIQKFDEPDTTCTLTNDDGGPFAMTGFELKKTAGTLDFETQSTYNLQIECTDGTLTTTDTYTVDVENLAPEITNLPTKGSIDESQEAELLLFGIELTEDATSCDQVAPIDDEFIVKFEPTTNLWSIYYVSSAVAGKSLDHSVTDVYEIGVACTDGTSTGDTKIYTIDVNENKAPEFTNVLGNPVTKVSINAKDVNATDTAFTVLAEDDELDLITYSLVGCEVNATCPFIMTPNGDIVATSDLHTDPEFQYTLQVMAEDDYNKNETIKTLIIEILDRNTPPELTNLPRLDVVGVEENNAAGDVVFDINHEDPDTGDTVKYFCNFPDGGNAFFACNEDTGEVTALNAIDYEQMTRLEYRVETYVNDGYADSATETFKLRIKDVNEPPEFQTTQWTVTKADEGGPGQEVDCPKFSDDIRDEDINDVLSYTMSCPDGNGVFVMDSSTGCITMTEEWDLDLPSKRLARETIQCTVVATDQGGNTTEAQLDIVIKESDDNIPYTDQTSYIYCAQQGTSGGGMGQITTSDNDVLAKHRQYTYDFTGGGPFSSDGNGVVTYGDLSNYALGTSFDSTLRVTDDGGNFSETPVTVMICDEETYRSYMTSNSVSNTNTNSNSGSSSSSSTSSSSSDMDWLYWLIPALLLGALLAGLLAYLIRRCCLSGRCGQRWVKGGKFGGGRMVRGGAAGGGGMKMRKVTVMRRRVVMGQQGGGYSQTGAYSNLQEAGSPPGTATQNGTPAVGNGNAQKAITPPKPASPPTPAANGTGNQPVQPLPKREPGTIAPMELPITHYYARDVGNLGGAYPT